MSLGRIALIKQVTLLDQVNAPVRPKMVEQCANEILRRHGATDSTVKRCVFIVL